MVPHSPLKPKLLINLSQRSPVTVAFVVKGDEDHVHVGHSPSMYPADPTSVSPFDNLVVVLLGNDINSATPLVLPASSFARPAGVRTLDVATIVGATVHGAAPAVLRSGLHGARETNASKT